MPAHAILRDGSPISTSTIHRVSFITLSHNILNNAGWLLLRLMLADILLNKHGGRRMTRKVFKTIVSASRKSVISFHMVYTMSMAIRSSVPSIYAGWHSSSWCHHSVCACWKPKKLRGLSVDLKVDHHFGSGFRECRIVHSAQMTGTKSTWEMTFQPVRRLCHILTLHGSTVCCELQAVMQ